MYNNRKLKFLYLSILQILLTFSLIFTIFIYYYSILKGGNGINLSLFGGGDDGYFYYKQAIRVFKNQPWIKTSMYPWLVGTIFKFIGSNSVLIMRLFNLVGFYLLIFYSLLLLKYQIIGESNKFSSLVNLEKVIYTSSLIFYLSSNIHSNMSVNRDVWIYLFYIASVLIGLIIIRNRNSVSFFGYLLVLAVLLFILGEFRSYALISYIISTITYLVFIFFSKSKSRFLLVIALIIASYFYFKFFKELNIPIVNLNLKQALEYRDYFIGENAGGSQMLISLNQNSYISFLFLYLYSFSSNLFGPFIWQIKNFPLFVIFIIESVPFISILLFLFVSRKKLNIYQKYILFHSFVWISLISFTNDNLGTATRLRPIAWILILSVFSNVFAKKLIFSQKEKLSDIRKVI